MSPPIPVTIITGFLGAGKTTIILNLIPQVPPDYRLALLKNEFGDLAVDSQLASANSISGVRELLNGCICCNLVGQLGDALLQLCDEVNPDRIVIETSGSAFPATLAMEVNRISRENDGKFVLDGVISVIDVENWEGYDDTSYTAKLQAKYTDLIIFNKWEDVPEDRFDVCLDRAADLELDTAWEAYVQEHSHGLGEPRENEHQSEVDVLSVSLTSSQPSDTVNTEAFTTLLLSAPKDEVYRIKGIIQFPADSPPEDSSGEKAQAPTPKPTPAPTRDEGNGNVDGVVAPERGAATIKTQNYILNWAFGRWTYTRSPASIGNASSTSKEGARTVPPESTIIASMTLILARGESHKWTRKLESEGLLEVAGDSAENRRGVTKVERLA
ncbi:CobW domain-containing protein [Histoplasma capsulatum var. duboisii H88]|uniref:CobW domain-containing protein n=1 Tax=Ajellomyces capsulatus (strain H88) TaxID=544711 RepID=F0U9K8_AJEC8|nr:CobW domain-containing protein [Histoplasma capsulatum var. duboisii H88]